MNALIKPGRVFVAVGFTGLSILCLIKNDFIVGRPPAWPASFNLNPILAYATAATLFVCVLGILSKKNGVLAALIISSLILFLSLIRHLHNFVDWANAWKTIALLGGTLIVANSFLRDDSRLTPSFRVYTSGRKILTWIGCSCLAAFFVVAGYAHFKFVDFVSALIPSYIPFHVFFTYVTGFCLLAGGIGIMIPATRKWAALLAGMMVFGWFVLLHIPRFVANMNDDSDRLGLFESLAFSGMFLILAGISKRND